MKTEQSISQFARQFGIHPLNMDLLARTMKIISRKGQFPKQNYYSAKSCECCGTYHGDCGIKVDWYYEYQSYLTPDDDIPEAVSDTSCDGCSLARDSRDFFEKDEGIYTCPPEYHQNDDNEVYVFEGQNPKVDCPYFRPCKFCQGTGVYANKLLEYLGKIYLETFDTAEDYFDLIPVNAAVLYYWQRKIDESSYGYRYISACEFDQYLSDPSACPFCHGTKLDDPIETLLVSNISLGFMDNGVYDDAIEGITALSIWRSMKYAKRLYNRDFRAFEKLKGELL
ncbi:MAG: hypothetical protein WC936_06285 [Candidatus Nanoarchaeia archaeon]|jgi:hypothetical protein